MGDAPAPAQTLTQVNAEFLSTRASRLDTAIAKALESKLPPPPKAGKAGKPGSQPAVSAPSSSNAAPTASSSRPGSEASTSSSLDADTESAALEAVEAQGDGSAPAADEAQDEAQEPAAAAFDPAEVNALAKKKDLRAVEKLLGLEEGVLGATNGEYAALRRRTDEVAAREKAEDERHSRNNQTLINKFGPTVELVELAGKGDIRAYAAALERTTGISVARFVQAFAANVPQLSARELELEREVQRLRGQGGTPAPPVTQDGSGAKPAPDAAKAKADAYITGEVKEHAALKLKGGLDEVRAKWLASFDKRTKSFGLTPQAAADAVVEDRRKLREQESWLLAGKKLPAKPRTRALSRTGASETQPRKQTLTREQLIERGAQMIRQQKAADARAQRR